MKISEATLADVKKHLRIDYDFDDPLIEIIMGAAKGFILSQTSIPEEELDDIPDMIYAYFCVCGSMYEERTMQADNIKINPTADYIIASHRRNYL